jgi:radical SAM protein with 4Fe4S-binding SPASM domain
MAKLSQGGCRLLRVTGGEPLLREDLVEALRFARASFEEVVLQTNGTLLNQRIADELVEVVDRVEVAVDGSTPRIHEAIRGAAAFEKTVAGIKHLQRAGIRTIINRVLTRFSVDDGPNMEALAHSLGADLRSDMYLAIGRGREARQRLAVPPEQLACARDGEVSQTGSEQDRADQLRMLSATRVRERCGAITEKISISPHGKVYPCELLRGPEFAVGSIRDSRSLSALLKINNPVVQAILTRTVEAVTKCSACDVRYFCDGLCMAEAHSHTGSIWGIDPNCPVKKAQLGMLLGGETGS